MSFVVGATCYTTEMIFGCRVINLLILREMGFGNSGVRLILLCASGCSYLLYPGPPPVR